MNPAAENQTKDQYPKNKEKEQKEGFSGHNNYLRYLSEDDGQSRAERLGHLPPKIIFNAKTNGDRRDHHSVTNDKWNGRLAIHRVKELTILAGSRHVIFNWT